MGSILWLLVAPADRKVPPNCRRSSWSGWSPSWSDLADPISSLKDAPRSAWACSWRRPLLRSLSRGPLRRCLRPRGVEALSGVDSDAGV
jgi:hypothetical protein